MSKLDRLISELCPDGVEFVKIGEICQLSAGGDVPKNKMSKNPTDIYNIPIYSNGIGENALYGWTDEARINKPCVTIAARGTIGYCVLREEPFVPVVRLICAIPNDNVNVRYLKYAIEVLPFRVPISGIPQLTVPMVSKYEIPLPPLPVQRKIVRILDNFAELTAELTTELTAELTARKKQYEYYKNELLTFGDDVPMVSLGEIATAMYRGAGIKREGVTEDGTPCVRYGEIYTTYGIWFDSCVSHTQSGKKTFEHGDILFAITGESVEEIAKSCAYTGHETCYAGSDIVVMKHKQNPKYIAYALSTTDAQAQKSKGKVKSKVVHSSVPALKTITIPLPSLEEQARIVAILDKFDALATDISMGLAAEIEARKTQFEYYRGMLLTFEEVEA